LAVLLATHWSYLGLPYYWDELGFFIPAAHDLFRAGLLAPQSTPPEVHPPLVMLYLAASWKLFGFSAPVTRVAMLVVGAGTVAAAYALGRRLSTPPAAAWTAVLLLVSPPFVAQSMLAHLDLAAAMWTLAALCWFLDRRWRLCGLALTLLVLTKETAVVVPLALAVTAGKDRRPRWPLLLPVLALGAWVGYLRAVTGHWAGNPEFASYNVAGALEAGRSGLALLRRLYQLGISNFHWVAALLVLAGRRALAGPGWRACGAIVAAYLALHSVLGGALLLRYLLPALALLYLAAATAGAALRPVWRNAALAGLAAGLAISNWWNPPYPFSYEDNLAVVDFIALEQQAAGFVSEHLPGKVVTTAWPLTDALTNPLAGYVSRPIQVRAVENFQPLSWATLRADDVEVVAIYSRSWEPEGGWQTWAPAARLLETYFGYRAQIRPQELIQRLGLRRLARWERRGQWMEILAR